MAFQPLAGKNIILGVTGSIAAYKSVDLASKLSQSGAQVHAILTKSASRFVTPLSFQAVTGNKAYTDDDLWGNEAHVLHVDLTRDLDLFIIAPITANSIAKLAHGFGDDLLSLAMLTLGSGENTTPVLIAPAMDARMYSHTATQDNLKILVNRGISLIGPEEGHLASGLSAKGRMSEPSAILGRIRYMLSRSGLLAGKHIVVTAGGTREPIDPVRVITNLSSGKQGLAIAQTALDYGADVTLIAPPLSLPDPAGIKRITVRTAEEMHQSVLDTCSKADILIMAAAVADFRPAKRKNKKIKKSGARFTIDLEPTIDILEDIARMKQTKKYPRFVVGFAAETNDLIQNAKKKIRAKKLDMIVANDVSAPDAGFSVDTNKVVFLYPDGKSEALPLLNKTDVADELIKRVLARFNQEP